MSAPSQVDLIAIIKCQAYVRAFLERKNYKWIKSVRDTRGRIVKEIHSTEVTYRDGLTFLLERFKKPLEEDANGAAKLVTKEQVRLLFSSELPVMVGYSNMLINDLENNVLKNWNDNTKVGPVFVKMLNFFKGYSQYVNTFEKARDMIHQLKSSNNKFATFLREKEMQNGVLTPMESWLITPVQRIPRYALLLDQLLKHTWKTHPDYKTLVAASTMAGTISEQVNDMKRQREGHDKLLQIYNMLVIGKKEHWDKQLLVEKKTRTFVREGLLTENMINGKATEFHSILFNDLILWTKLKKDQYEFKSSNDLKNAKIDLKGSSGNDTWIHLRCEGGMRVFRAETEDETIMWYTSIKTALGSILPDGLQITTSTAPVERPMKTDKSNPSVNAAVIDRDVAIRLAKDERRKPRGIRSTQLKLSELRFIDDRERNRNERISEQVSSIRMWQAMPDRADLARFELTDAQVAAMFFIFKPETYQAYYEMTQALASLSLHSDPPEIVLLGRQGAGKTSLLNSLLGYPFPLDDLKRPLFIHMVTNPAHPMDAPAIWIRKDYTQKPKITKDVSITSPDHLAKELSKRASKDYSESPIHVFFEAQHVLNCTIIDTPGLDAMQFHDDAPAQGASSKSSSHGVTVRSLVYEVASHPNRHLLFVEESLHKGLMGGSFSGLATVVDPALTRSNFVFTKFHHELREMWQFPQLNAYFMDAPTGSFFVTLPSAETLASAANQTEVTRLQAQAYVRDLDHLNQLQYDTKYAPSIGIHNLRRHVFSWVHTKHIQSIPRALEQLNTVTDTTAAQFASLKPRHSWVELSKLRQVANAFTHDVVKVLPEILFGSTRVEAKVHGHTHADERYKMDIPHSRWVDLWNQPIIAENEEAAWVASIPYHNAKLYGSAQMIRLFSSFNLVVQELQLRNVPHEEIAAAVRQGRAMNTRDYYLNAALTLAHHKAESSLLPLVKQLCQRASEIIKRLGDIATHVVEEGGLSNGIYKHEMDIPLFIGHVRVMYENCASLLADQCLTACTGVLDQVLISDVDKYAFAVPADIDSEAEQAKVIITLVASMFKDISRLFVRNVTAKCYEILVARGVEEIGCRMQNDIAGLTETDLSKLFDVGSFKLEIEKEEKQLKAYDATVTASKQAFSKAVAVFSSQPHRRMDGSVTYKKVPYDPSLEVSRPPVTPTSKKSKANAGDIKITTAKKPSSTDDDSAPPPKSARHKDRESTNGSAEATKLAPEPTKLDRKTSDTAKPAPEAAKAAEAPKAAPEAAKPTAEPTKPAAEPAKLDRKPSEPAKPNAEVSKPSEPSKPAPEAAKPAPEAAKPVSEPANPKIARKPSEPVKPAEVSKPAPVSPSPPPAASSSASPDQQASSSNETKAKSGPSPVAEKPARTSLDRKTSTSAVPSPEYNDPDSLMRPSAKKMPASNTGPVVSPGTGDAKGIIPQNNAAAKRALLEKGH